MSITRRDFLRLSAYGFGTAFLAACGYGTGGNPAPLNPTDMPALSPTVISQALTELGFEAFADKMKFIRMINICMLSRTACPITH